VVSAARASACCRCGVTVPQSAQRSRAAAVSSPRQRAIRARSPTSVRMSFRIWLLAAHLMVGQEAKAFACRGCKDASSVRVVSWERRKGGMSRLAGPLR
jgi:hypothetical protein